MRLSCVVLAHESEVMSVDFSPLSGRLLASGSRDRLVHVFDARTGYRLRETLDHHSSSITAVRCVWWWRLGCVVRANRGRCHLVMPSCRHTYRDASVAQVFAGRRQAAELRR